MALHGKGLETLLLAGSVLGAPSSLHAGWWATSLGPPTPSFQAGILGVPPFTPQGTLQGLAGCLGGRPGAAVWTLPPGPQFLPLDGWGPSPSPLPPPPSPALPPPIAGAAGRTVSQGPAAKMRPQGVLWLSRLSQAEFHARPLGTVRACGAGARDAGPFITWAAGSPFGTVFIWP